MKLVITLLHAEKTLCQNTVSYFPLFETEVLHKATSKLFTSIENVLFTNEALTQSCKLYIFWNKANFNHFLPSVLMAMISACKGLGGGFSAYWQVPPIASEHLSFNLQNLYQVKSFQKVSYNVSS